jgi:hypothetical protein
MSDAASVRFDFTIEDLVDAGQRNADRSRVVQRMRQTTMLGGGILVTAVLFFVVPGPTLLRLLVALTAGFLAAMAYPSLRRSAVRERLKAYWLERLKSAGPFTCEVDLTAEGITVRQLSTTTSTPWSALASVTEVPDGVEILGKKGGFILVRERAFASPEAKRVFAERIRASLVP